MTNIPISKETFIKSIRTIQAVCQFQAGLWDLTILGKKSPTSKVVG